MNDLTALSATKAGRIILHVICALRRPANWRWHARGIARELAPEFTPHSGGN
ncbi:MAG TPA: hypothetical protein VI136_03235 [Verrucomicrobiae bacterium]